jgi:hypothetical protein
MTATLTETKTRRQQLLHSYSARLEADAELQEVAAEIRSIEGMNPVAPVDWLQFSQTGYKDSMTPKLCQRYAELHAIIDAGIVAEHQLRQGPFAHPADERRYEELRDESRAIQSKRTSLEASRDRLWAMANAPAERSFSSTVQPANEKQSKTTQRELDNVQAKLRACDDRMGKVQQEMTALSDRKLELDPQPIV